MTTTDPEWESEDEHARGMDDEPDTDWIPPADKGETRDEGDDWTPLPVPEADDGDI